MILFQECFRSEVKRLRQAVYGYLNCILNCFKLFFTNSGSLETFLSRPERNVGMWHRKNNFTIAGHDYSLLGWFDEFIKLVGDTQRAYDLTQALRDQAYRESIDIKIRVEQHNEIIPLVYDWDKPWPPEDQQHRERFGSWNDR